MVKLFQGYFKGRKLGGLKTEMQVSRMDACVKNIEWKEVN
jgi:hypothetical protein